MSFLPVGQMPGVKGTPLYIETPVSSTSNPYLVTATKSLLWVEKAMGTQEPFVRAAVRQDGARFEDLFPAIVQKIAGREGLGNGFLFDQGGLLDALHYLRVIRGVAGDLELVVGLTGGNLIELPDGVTLVRAKWVPSYAGILVPQDPPFGIVRVFGESYAFVIHDVRGLAILGSWGQPTTV